MLSLPIVFLALISLGRGFHGQVRLFKSLSAATVVAKLSQPEPPSVEIWMVTVPAPYPFRLPRGVQAIERLVSPTTHGLPELTVASGAVRVSLPFIWKSALESSKLRLV